VLGKHHLVSSTHYHASQAGYAAFELGGNAIDAGVAGGLAMNVVTPHYSDLGGVAPIMIFTPGMKAPTTIDGLGWAPRSATRDAFVARYGEDVRGGLATTVVPAALDAWLTALERFGRLSLTQVLGPAIDLADGFPVFANLAIAIREREAALRSWPSSAAVFLPGGRPPEVGEILRRPELAALLRKLAEIEQANAGRGRAEAIRAARDYFYRGDPARMISDFIQSQGGFLDYEDIAGYSVTEEPPMRASYRGYDVFSSGPWCQGPAVTMTLNILASADLSSLGHNTTAYIHHVTEALKLAFADRDAYVADPRMVDVPVAGLVDPAYGEQQARRIDPAHAAPGMPEPGDPWPFEGRERPPSGWKPPVARPGRTEPDTTYICAMDEDGNAFSATPSDNSFLSPSVPGLGIMASTRGQQFWLDPGHPCVIAPGKRPRLTPNPAMVLRDGAAHIAFGSPGGDVQPQAMVQFVCNVLDHGMDVQEAIEATRFRTHSFPNSFLPHIYEPGLLELEAGIEDSVAEALAALGHRIRRRDRWIASRTGVGVAVCAIRMVEPGVLAGGADPAQDSYVVGR
jgi:gamma-glutamyltranspeptidase/glutathione hydrolase